MAKQIQNPVVTHTVVHEHVIISDRGNKSLLALSKNSQSSVGWEESTPTALSFGVCVALGVVELF